MRPSRPENKGSKKRAKYAVSFQSSISRLGSESEKKDITVAHGFSDMHIVLDAFHEFQSRHSKLLQDVHVLVISIAVLVHSGQLILCDYKREGKVVSYEQQDP